MKPIVLISFLLASFIGLIIYKTQPFKTLESTVDISSQTFKTEDEIRSLETNKLPLNIQSVDIGHYGKFENPLGPSRGALTSVSGNLLLVDRGCNFYKYNSTGKRLNSINLPKVPNNASEYYKVIKEDFKRMDDIRCLYTVYDPKKSKLYVSTTNYDTSTNASSVAIYVISFNIDNTNILNNWRKIYQTDPIPIIMFQEGSAGLGGRLIIANDKLIFSIGDATPSNIISEEIETSAQRLDNPFGKIYALSLNNYKLKVISIGHKNPQGLVYTSSDQIIDVEHGPEGGDELNIIQDGGNYGWPYRTFGTNYGTYTWPLEYKEKTASHFIQPIYSWVPSVAVSPIIEVSSFDKAWDKNLLVGSLKARSLYRIVIYRDRLVLCEPIWLGKRIRDLKQIGPTIYALTDDAKLLEITKDTEKLKSNKKTGALVEINPSFTKCLTCHHLTETNPQHLAPSLRSIIGRKIGSDNFNHYSEALRDKKDIWSKSNLKLFLKNPSEFASGTSMPKIQLYDFEIDQIVDILEKTK